MFILRWPASSNSNYRGQKEAVDTKESVKASLRDAEVWRSWSNAPPLRCGVPSNSWVQIPLLPNFFGSLRNVWGEGGIEEGGVL